MSVSFYEFVEHLNDYLYNNPTLRNLPVSINDGNANTRSQLLEFFTKAVDINGAEVVEIEIELSEDATICPPTFSHDC